MLSRGDDSPREGHRVEVPDILRQTALDRHPQHLIEVAVVEMACPIDRQRCAAHDSLGCRRMVSLNQLIHVGLILSRLQKMVQESANGHIRDGEESIEDDVVSLGKLLSIGFFQLPLRRR